MLSHRLLEPVGSKEPKLTVMETNNACVIVDEFHSRHLNLCVSHGTGAHDFFQVGSLQRSVGFDAPEISRWNKGVDGSIKKGFENLLGLLDVLCVYVLGQRRKEFAVECAVR